MIATTTPADPVDYPSYVHNCTRNAACEPAYVAPIPGISQMQFYVDFGSFQPFMLEFQLVNVCNNNDLIQIFPSNYVIGQTPEGGYYGVFKYFTELPVDVTSFVVWLSATGAGATTKTYFSQMMELERCLPLMKIKSCQPELATTTGFDVNGIYYGLPDEEGDILGISTVRYFHIAWVRHGKVRELGNKGTFKSSLTRNFRTTIEKTFQVETELVPQWYKDQLLAIYARGAVQINDVKTYLVSDLNFEAINDDDLIWKPFAQLKETFRLFFGCDESECFECCSPVVLHAYTGIPGESESPAP